jgi:hypothetical protein
MGHAKEAVPLYVPSPGYRHQPAPKLRMNPFSMPIDSRTTRRGKRRRGAVCQDGPVTITPYEFAAAKAEDVLRASGSRRL